MKKIYVLFALLATPILSFAASPSNQELTRAAGKVNSFFSDFRTISKERHGYNVSSIKMGIMEKYFEVSSEQHAPNEFNALGYPNNYEIDISVDTYVSIFVDMFSDSRFVNCTFDYNVLTNQSSLVKRRAEFTKGETPIEFAKIVVRKTYRQGYTVLKVFNDTLVVNLNNLTICRWANEVSTFHIGGLDSNVETENYEQMRLNAELAYDGKEYKKAYSIYEKMAQKYPKEGDSYYRMAVMLYKKQVYSYLGRSERMTRVLNNLDLAVTNGGYNTKKWADNMRYWVTGGQLGNRA